MRAARHLAWAAATLFCLPALAQEVPAVSETAGTSLQEVERGGYAGSSFGFAMTRAQGAWATGTALDVDLGYDFTSFFGLGAFVWGASMSPSSAALGDFSALFPGAEIRLYLPVASDANGVKRLFFDVRAGGGVMLFQGGSSAAAPAGRLGASLEYFTRLRHFSVGLSLDGVAAFPGGSLMWGGALSPFARYSF
ncbi:MAG: adventurous gliding motility protein CglE [Myxococcales bacterium]